MAYDKGFQLYCNFFDLPSPLMIKFGLVNQIPGLLAIIISYQYKIAVVYKGYY